MVLLEGTLFNIQVSRRRDRGMPVSTRHMELNPLLVVSTLQVFAKALYRMMLILFRYIGLSSFFFKVLVQTACFVLGEQQVLLQSLVNCFVGCPLTKTLSPGFASATS